MLVKVEYNEWYNAQNWYFQPTFHRFEACVYWFSMHFAKLSIVSVHEGKKVSSEIWKRHGFSSWREKVSIEIRKRHLLGCLALLVFHFRIRAVDGNERLVVKKFSVGCILHAHHSVGDKRKAHVAVFIYYVVVLSRCGERKAESAEARTSCLQEELFRFIISIDLLFE